MYIYICMYVIYTSAWNMLTRPIVYSERSSVHWVRGLCCLCVNRLIRTSLITDYSVRSNRLDNCPSDKYILSLPSDHNARSLTYVVSSRIQWFLQFYFLPKRFAISKKKIIVLIDSIITRYPLTTIRKWFRVTIVNRDLRSRLLWNRIERVIESSLRKVYVNRGRQGTSPFTRNWWRQLAGHDSR